MKRISLITLISFATISLAHAHAFLDHASPRVGSTVAAPDKLELWMTEDLEPAFTNVQVFDAQGKEIHETHATVNGSTMTLPLPKLPPGTYLVKWKAVATDTHHTAGTFKFTVR